MGPSDLGFWIDSLKLRGWTADFTGEEETAPGTDHPPDTNENLPSCGFSGIFEASDVDHCWRQGIG